MPTNYEDGDFTTAAINGDDRVDRPFAEQGDSTTQVIYRPMIVNRADYTPLALDTAHPDVATAYLVNERNFQDVGCGVMTFERVYAQIPADRDEVFTGTTAYTFPGIRSKDTGGTERNVTAAATSGNVTTITCTNTVSVGDVVFIEIASSSGGSTINVSNFTRALSGTTASQVNVPAIALLTFDSGTLTELTIQPRPQKSLPVSTFTDFKYYLPGVTTGITDIDDIDTLDTFSAFSARSGERVSVLDDETIPDVASYIADVTAGNFLVIESTLTRWHGNIIQRADVKVRAI